MVNGRVGFQVNRLRGGGGIPGHPSVFSFHEKMAFKNAGRLFYGDALASRKNMLLYGNDKLGVAGTAVSRHT